MAFGFSLLFLFSFVGILPSSTICQSDPFVKELYVIALPAATVLPGFPYSRRHLPDLDQQNDPKIWLSMGNPNRRLCVPRPYDHISCLYAYSSPATTTSSRRTKATFFIVFFQGCAIFARNYFGPR